MQCQILGQEEWEKLKNIEKIYSNIYVKKYSNNSYLARLAAG